jgi:hypothetical protein
METTKLWQIIKKMPKGALLHAHMDAMVDFDFLFDVLLTMPGMHIYCNKSLSNPPALEAAAVKFRYWKKENGVFAFCSYLLGYLISDDFYSRGFYLEVRLCRRYPNFTHPSC